MARGKAEQTYSRSSYQLLKFLFFQADDGIRDGGVTGVQTCALPISHPYAQFAALQAIKHRHEIRPEDAERNGDLGLVTSRILVDQQQHGKLRRGKLQRRDAAQKILEDLQLRALERIAEQLGQFAHLQRRAFASTFGRVFAASRLGE